MEIMKGVKDEKAIEPMQLLEKAISSCTFGKFHCRLLAASIASAVANNIVSINTSYILPSAECDLNLSILEKGILNAVPFVGTILGGVFAGIISDTFGRRKSIIYSSLGLFLCCIFEGSSQTYIMLAIGKFIEGIIMSIGYNADLVMVSEFCHKDIRDRITLTVSAFRSVAIIIGVLLTWGILTQNWHFTIIPGVFEIYTWSIYLYVCGLAGFLTALLYYFIPESPKFLLANGQSEKALQILRNVYIENTGKSAESFPIKSLGEHNNSDNENAASKKFSIAKRLTVYMLEMKPVWRSQLLTELLKVSFINFIILLTYNTYRLWYPQLSTIIESYLSEHNTTNNFCTILDDYVETLNIERDTSNLSFVTETECIPQLSGTETYTNGIIMGIVCVITNAVTFFLMKPIGQIPLLILYLIVCTLCSIGLNWCYTSVQIMVLVSTIVGLTQSSLGLVSTIVVRVFPTSVRTMSVSVFMTFGRIGTVVGNVLFPVMLQEGCMVPFFILAALTTGVAVLVIFLPNPTKDNKHTGDK